MTGELPTNSNFLTRRQFAGLAGYAFGHLPLASLLLDRKRASGETGQHPAKVSKVVFFFMNGGPSQIDTFDHKPMLARYDGTPYQGETDLASGTRVAGDLWKSEFRFHQHGECGLEISELYPHISRFADNLCVIRSMQTTSALHAPALLRMNTGSTRLDSACLGSWIDYALGQASEELPDYVVMLDPRGGPIGGQSNWSTGPLSAPPASVIAEPLSPFNYLSASDDRRASSEEAAKNLLRSLNSIYATQSGRSVELKQRDTSRELAWQMGASASEAANLAAETATTHQRYGLRDVETQDFGTRCLLARRLLERGVRFIQIYSGGGRQQDTWDSHTDHLARHRKFANETDQPIAAFLDDLKSTGLWDQTLVIWGGEFGRTPTVEKGSNGRDHNPHGFSMWLAGGGVRGGQAIGATDELGLEAVENVCGVSDLHATVLHLMGVDHSELKTYLNGLEIGLTGPEPCRIIQEALA